MKDLKVFSSSEFGELGVLSIEGHIQVIHISAALVPKQGMCIKMDILAGYEIPSKIKIDHGGVPVDYCANR